MSVQQTTQSKHPFPRIRPAMLLRLTQEAAIRSGEADTIEWEDLKKQTQQGSANDQPG